MLWCQDLQKVIEMMDTDKAIITINEYLKEKSPCYKHTMEGPSIYNPKRIVKEHIYEHEYYLDIGNRDILFPTRAALIKWMRETHRSNPVRIKHKCIQCGEYMKHNFTQVKGKGRGWQKMGLRRRTKSGDTIKYKGKSWKVRSVQWKYERAVSHRDSAQSWNDEMIEKHGVGGMNGNLKKKEYVIKFHIWTQDYELKLIPVYFILVRDLE